MTENIEQSTDNETSSPHGHYDAVSKKLIQDNPEDWIRFGLGIPDVDFLQIIETEQHTIKSNRADSFYLQVLMEKNLYYILKYRHEIVRINLCRIVWQVI